MVPLEFDPNADRALSEVSSQHSTEDRGPQIEAMSNLSVMGAIGSAFENTMGTIRTLSGAVDVVILTDGRTYPDLEQFRDDANSAARLLSIPLLLADFMGFFSNAEALLTGLNNWGKETQDLPPKRIGFPFRRVAQVTEISLVVIKRVIWAGLTFSKYTGRFQILEYAAFEQLKVMQSVAGISANLIGIGLSVRRIYKKLEIAQGDMTIVGQGLVSLNSFKAKKADLEIKKEVVEIAKKVVGISLDAFSVYALFYTTTLRFVFIGATVLTGANFYTAVMRGLIKQVDSHMKKAPVVLT